MCSIYFSKINYFKQLKKNTLSILVFFLKYQNRSSMVRFFWKGLRIFRWTISSKEIAIQIDFPKRRDQILRLFLGIFLEERKFERMRNALRIFRKDISSSWRWTFLTNYCKKYSLPFFLNTFSKGEWSLNFSKRSRYSSFFQVENKLSRKNIFHRSKRHNHHLLRIVFSNFPRDISSLDSKFIYTFIYLPTSSNITVPF